MFIVQVHKNKLKVLYDKSFIRNNSLKKKGFRTGQNISPPVLCNKKAVMGCAVHSFVRLSHFLRLWMNLPIWNQTRSPSSVLTRWFVTEIFPPPPFSTFLWMSSKGAILTAQSWAFRQSAAIVFCASVCAKNSYCADLQQGLVSIWAFFSAASRPSWGKSAGGWQRGKKIPSRSHFFFCFCVSPTF